MHTCGRQKRGARRQRLPNVYPHIIFPMPSTTLAKAPLHNYFHATTHACSWKAWVPRLCRYMSTGKRTSLPDLAMTRCHFVCMLRTCMAISAGWSTTPLYACVPRVRPGTIAQWPLLLQARNGRELC